MCFYQIDQFSGDNSEGETPVPVPNTVVKAFGAHDTSRETSWESRTLPGFFIEKLVGAGLNPLSAGFFYCLIVCSSFDKTSFPVL